MMSQFLRFRVVLPKIRSCLVLGTERCSKPSSTSQWQFPARSYMKSVSDKFESKLRARDMVPDGYNLVYRGGMDYYIHLAYSASTLMMLVGFVNIAIVFFKTDLVVYFPVPLSDAIIGLKNYTQFVIMYGACFLMLLACRYISVRYVMRMYYNPETKTYKAIRVGHLPMAISQHDFQAGTLHRIPKVYAMRLWKNIEYKTQDDSLLLFDHGFKTSADYDRMFVPGSSDIHHESRDQNLPKYRN